MKRSFTWAWFTVPLSTAGIALLLATTPHRFVGLFTIGKIFFILALVTFVAAVGAISFRFSMQPSNLKCSLMHPHEALFLPTAVLSCESYTTFLAARMKLIASSGELDRLRSTIRCSVLWTVVHSSHTGALLDIHCDFYNNISPAVSTPIHRSGYEADCPRHDASMDVANFPFPALGTNRGNCGRRSAHWQLLHDCGCRSHM